MDRDLKLSEMVDLPEAAKRLGLHRATVNDMVLNQRLPGYRLGSHWYLRNDDLERFAATYERPKNAPRRRSKAWGEDWQSEIVRWISFWHSTTSSELDRVLDLHIGNIRKYLTLLERDGFVSRDADGFWKLSDDGVALAAKLPEIEPAA